MIQYDIHIDGCIATSLDFKHSPRVRKRVSVMGDVAQAAPAAAEGEVIELIELGVW
jgi:hypothetical protein